MKITVRTRSQNSVLYELMISLIPPSIECIRDTGYSRWEDAAVFLHDAIENTCGMLLIADEDTFITNWNSIEKLCTVMKERNYTHAGVPDGGLIAHRTHSYLHFNPFMVIFNCDLIHSSKKTVTRHTIDASIYEAEMANLKPAWIQDNYHHDRAEPYAGLFYWLARIGKPLFLNASTLWDNISTKVTGPDNSTLCLHSWYSRLYKIDPVTRIRIDTLYKVAKRNIIITSHSHPLPDKVHRSSVR
jgi:hypothetical protein